MRITTDTFFRALIPAPSADELRVLEESIVRAGGATVPLVVWNGVLLDGHNRHEICTRLGLPFDTRDAEPWIKTREDAEIWIIDNQMGRRNLSVIDRVALQTRRAEVLRVRAAENRKAGLATSGKRGGKGSDQVIETIHVDTRAAIAKAAGTSEGSVMRAQKVLADGVPELVDAVRANSVTLNAAAEIARLPKGEQAAEIDLRKRGVVRNPRAPKPAEPEEEPSEPAPPRSERSAFDQQVADALDRGLMVQEVAAELGCCRGSVSAAKRRMGMTRSSDSPAVALQAAAESSAFSWERARDEIERLVASSEREDLEALVGALCNARKSASALVRSINAHIGHGEGNGRHSHQRDVASESADG